MSSLPKTRIYKILSAEDWATSQALGYTKTALDDKDGYVHLSTREQVAETLRLHYSGQSEVKLLEYVLEQISGDIRWEASRGGQLFPHLYGTLRLGAARRTWGLHLASTGTPELPAGIDL